MTVGATVGMIGGSSEELMDEMSKGLIDEGTLDGLTVGRGREGLMVATFASEDRKGGSMLCSTIGRLSADPVRSIALLSVVCILGSFPATSSCM